MTDAKRDQNRVTGLLGVSSADGTTPLPIKINPATGRVLVEGTLDTITTPLELLSTDAGATGFSLEFYHNSASPAANDVIGVTRYYGKDSAGNKTEYAKIESVITDTTNGAENSELKFYVQDQSGALTQILSLDSNNGLTLKGGWGIGTDSGQDLTIGLSANDDLIFRGGLSAASTSTFSYVNARFTMAQGTDRVSATTLTFVGGNVFDITGSTTINHITTTKWPNGSILYLHFDASVTVTHNAGSPPADTAPILLAGAANFSATAGDNLTLILRDGTWEEFARTVI